MKTIDIGVDEGYPSEVLSNFHPYAFAVDGVHCASMEGFLQSVKFENEEKQILVCGLVGKQAKFKGKKKKWFREQLLYWKGQSFDRHSHEYQALLDRAFTSLSKNEEFQKALLATGTSKLLHSIGKDDPTKTILTCDEFLSRLLEIRNKLQR